jgi:uncharacterized hydrophobic protein (TIGR00271 family)
MSEYVQAAVFIHDDAGIIFRDELLRNTHGTDITCIDYEDFRQDPGQYLDGVSHMVLSADLGVLKELMGLASSRTISVGLMPLEKQFVLHRCYDIPRDVTEAIALALQDGAAPVDLIYCNDHIVLFKGLIGRIPLLEGRTDRSLLRVFLDGLKDMVSLRLLLFNIKTTGTSQTALSTAASGIEILESPDISFLSRMIAHEHSIQDGMISAVAVAPRSILDYLKLMWVRVFTDPARKKIPDSVGYIRTTGMEIDTEAPMNVNIDGVDLTTTPARLHIEPRALLLNHRMQVKTGSQGHTAELPEKFIVNSLPSGKEIPRSEKAKIPFFTSASEERFKDLFMALRADGKLDTTYIVLMGLSTILATVGLYLNSASVVIGAMLLAPLMAPIISLSMSLLRYDRKLFRQSFWKVSVGIALALGTAFLLTVVSPYQPLTAEMKGRLNPTVLDLVVAIVAGIAGAYTKSFKEILQSLAGVAIAVALVPPLAVAGIGLGRFDLAFFSQSFLLFSTNFIGIILAATFTFRVLGFSPVVRDKRSVVIVSLFFILICVPLTMAFHRIIEDARFEQSWEHERFLVNGKYLIVEDAELQSFGENDVLLVEILAREQLNRADLNEFKRKVKRNFADDLVIRAKIVYIP